MEDPMSPTNHSDPEDAGNEKFVSPSSSAESDELDRLWNRSTAKKLSLSPSRLQRHGRAAGTHHHHSYSHQQSVPNSRSSQFPQSRTSTESVPNSRSSQFPQSRTSTGSGTPGHRHYSVTRNSPSVPFPHHAPENNPPHYWSMHPQYSGFYTSHPPHTYPPYQPPFFHSPKNQNAHSSYPASTSVNTSIPLSEQTEEEESLVAPSPSVTPADTRRFRREDTKLSSRPEAGEKEYVVEVDEDGHVTGGCLGKDKYLDMLKQLCLRILDLSELKTKDQIRIQMVKRQLDDKFEYRGRDVCMIWFVSEVGLVLRRARSDLHSTWVKLGEQRDSPVPHGIATEQWHRLIDYWLSPSFIKKSQQMKECRSAVKNVNITGRAGTAGLLANMKRKRGSTPPLNEVQNEIAIRKSKQQLKSKTPGVSSVHADNLPDEGLRTSQAESEKDFFAGGSGFQTSAFDSAVSSGQNTTPEIKTFAENLKQEQEALQAEQQELKEGQKEIQKDQSGIKQKLLELDSKIDKLVKVVMNMSEEISPKGVSLQTETHNNIGEDFSRASKDSANSRSPSTALKKKNKLSKGFVVGDEVELREIKNAGRSLVAIGKIVDIGGKILFHSQEIKSGHAKIFLEKVIIGETPLLFPNLNDGPPHKFLKDVAGSFVIWPEKSLRRRL